MWRFFILLQVHLFPKCFILLSKRKSQKIAHNAYWVNTGVSCYIRCQRLNWHHLDRNCWLCRTSKEQRQRKPCAVWQKCQQLPPQKQRSPQRWGWQSLIKRVVNSFGAWKGLESLKEEGNRDLSMQPRAPHPHRELEKLCFPPSLQHSQGLDGAPEECG